MRLSVPIYQLKKQAKVQSRQYGVALNKALDDLAKKEGFASWSLLAKRHANRSPAAIILQNLSPSDLVLLGARPGHGKTLLGLELIAEALKYQAHAAFYSLEYTNSELVERFAALNVDAGSASSALNLDTSDDICADHVIKQLSQAPHGTVVVIDYLQLLDQNRAKPALAAQVSTLRSFARTAGITIVVLSQIDRLYDPATKPLPDILDVRLPNPIDLKLFTKTVFINDGKVDLQTTG